MQISPLAQLKHSWSQVEPGTPRERVQALLGAPQKVLHIDGTLVWYYVYPEVGPASVFFNASGKVSSRQSPSLGW
jgi:outer membrane protein assembly factor BamE (lipoprotein component of BamABCDE complex)